MNRVPKLRFPEFSGEWEIKKLGELVQINTGKKDTQDKIENGVYPFFVRSQTIEQINSYSFDGEAILTAGDGVGVGKVFHYINGKFDYHQRVYKLSNFNDISGKYLFGYFSTNFIKEVTKYTAKTSVDSVRMEMLTKMDIPVTSLPEQEEIASFLSSVDSKIKKLERKKELWEQYKKGMMQKIFSQELRFKDENGEDYPEWEEKSLGEIGEIVTGKTPSTEDESLWSGNIQFVTPTDINNSKYQISTLRTVTDNIKIKILPQNSIMYTCIASIGKMSLSVVPCITNQQINSVIPHNQNNEFIYYALLSITPQIKATQANTTLPIINKTAFSKFIVPLPSFPEQTEIADFLSSIDSKIEIVEKELAGMKEFKKGLLQKMFV